VAEQPNLGPVAAIQRREILGAGSQRSRHVQLHAVLCVAQQLPNVRVILWADLPVGVTSRVKAAMYTESKWILLLSAVASNSQQN